MQKLFDIKRTPTFGACIPNDSTQMKYCQRAKQGCQL